jgi:hypothetical protein
MSADDLLSRLEGVLRTGADRWMAKCPSHEDKRASLSIRETGDGTVLINCFAGCGAADVVASVGLEFDALFPPKPLEHARALPRPVFREDVFDLIRFEATVIWLIGCDMRQKKEIQEQDYQRLGQAIAKLERIGTLAYGS